jgi:hypothetical protein
MVTELVAKQSSRSRLAWIILGISRNRKPVGSAEPDTKPEEEAA